MTDRKVARSILDTRQMSPKEAAAAWAESVGVMFETRLRVGERFDARIDAYQLDELVLGTGTIVAQNFDRSRARIGRDSLDHLVLHFYTAGSCGRRDGASEHFTRPGDLFISDLAQPLATAVLRSETINLVVPRRLLAPLLRRPDEQSMRVLRGDLPLVALLRSHLFSLHEQAATMTVDEARSLIRPTLDLAAAAINSAVSEENAGSVNLALFGRICRYIEANVSRPTLSAEAVARHFGISLRKLYYLFERSGGFATYVQERRIWHCHAALVDPAQRDRTVADIATTHGFAHAESFSRAFRRIVGMTAREVRFHAARGRENPHALRHAGEWPDWIARMR
jgi:AraC-like DNA-binding protein